MPSIPALVEPEMLEWARKSANLTPLAAARKLKLPDARVEEWERGEAKPTIAQLRKAAALYKRSLAVFFLPEPPKEIRDPKRLPAFGTGVSRGLVGRSPRRVQAGSRTEGRCVGVGGTG